MRMRAATANTGGARGDGGREGGVVFAPLVQFNFGKGGRVIV